MHTKNHAIIVAAGKGIRFGSPLRKQYHHLDSMPVLSHTLNAFNRNTKIQDIFLIIPASDIDYCQQHIISPYSFRKKIHMVPGGSTRQQSVINGLTAVKNKTASPSRSIVLIHDGVRPLIRSKVIKSCIQGAVKFGACIPCVKIADTVKSVPKDNVIEKTVDRTFLYSAQTPQAFRLDLLQNAFDHAQKTGFSGTDDASIVEHFNHDVHVVEGDRINIKITTKEDLMLGKYLLTLSGS